METKQNGVQETRLSYIDNIRLLVITLVVILHTVCIYSGMGDFYYQENDNSSLDMISNVIFAFFLTFTQGYFMGLLFLVAGFFTPGSYDKKGCFNFIKDRLIRLGIPTLIYMLIIHPFIVYFLLRVKVGSFINYYSGYIRSLEFVGESGPLWFAAALLIFTLIYACIRFITNKDDAIKETRIKTPGSKNVIWLILLISICAFTVRQVYPIGTNVLNMQLCFFSQYIIFYIVGIVAYRNGWFFKIAYKSGIKWLKAALIPGVIAWLAIMLLGGATEGKFDLLYAGGFHWQSAAYVLWESFIGVSVSIGLITLFREKFNKQNYLIKTLADNSFAVYVFHAPIVIILTLALKSVSLPPLLKTLMACIIILLVCYAVTHYILRKAPLLKKVI